MLQVRDAIRFGPGALTIIALGLLLPYGTKLLKLLSPWLFKNFQGIRNVADQVIRTSKEKTERTGRVQTYFFIAYQVVSLTKCSLQWESVTFIRL